MAKIVKYSGHVVI